MATNGLTYPQSPVYIVVDNDRQEYVCESTTGYEPTVALASIDPSLVQYGRRTIRRCRAAEYLTAEEAARQQVRRTDRVVRIDYRPDGRIESATLVG